MMSPAHAAARAVLVDRSLAEPAGRLAPDHSPALSPGSAGVTATSLEAECPGLSGQCQARAAVASGRSVAGQRSARAEKREDGAPGPQRPPGPDPSVRCPAARRIMGRPLPSGEFSSDLSEWTQEEAPARARSVLNASPACSSPCLTPRDGPGPPFQAVASRGRGLLRDRHRRRQSGFRHSASSQSACVKGAKSQFSKGSGDASAGGTGRSATQCGSNAGRTCGRRPGCAWRSGGASREMPASPQAVGAGPLGHGWPLGLAWLGAFAPEEMGAAVLAGGPARRGGLHLGPGGSVQPTAAARGAARVGGGGGHCPCWRWQ